MTEDFFQVLLESAEPAHRSSRSHSSGSPSSFVKVYQKGHNHSVRKHLHHHPFRAPRFNQFGILGNVGGLHPGLLQSGLARTVVPLVSNSLGLTSGLSNAAVFGGGVGLRSPVATANLIASTKAAKINAELTAATAGVANPTLGLVNPFLNQGILRPDIWQLGLPHLGLSHHRLLQSHGLPHSGLFHPSSHLSGFGSFGYGFPYGTGIPFSHGGPHHTHHHDNHHEDHHHDHAIHHEEHQHHDDDFGPFPHKHPVHLPVHPEDLDFIEMNEDAPFQAPSCSRISEKKWCIEDKRYPIRQIEHAGHLHAQGLMDLYADISDLDTELSVKGKRFLNEETYLCPSETSYIRPVRALNTQGKWKVIVNDVKIHYQKLSQSVRVEECLTKNEPCPLIPHCYKTKCLQKFVYHKFLVFDPYDHNFPFAIDTFRMPSSCSCKIDKYFLNDYY